jgi:pyruvate kinase
MKSSYSHTKIIATIGPASSSKEVLKKMILAGVDVCRLNFSHGKHEEHLKVINNIREINKELSLSVSILADLQGPKLRVGEIENGELDLLAGEEIVFVTKECIGTKEHLYISYQQFPQDVKAGESILIDDGKIKLEVLETNKKDKVTAKVVYGGILKPRKGVNLPNTKISQPCLSEKDLKDLNFALEQNVDWIALSFVREVTDIVELKEIIKKQKKKTFVIAKIEKPEALENINAIIDLTDGIMVARGDLGVEVDFFTVPLVQRSLVEKCYNASKPVIIATQMMEGMINNFRPTRAEVNDVASAVLMGADTLMLSGETSVGKFPIEVINSMHKVIQHTEQNAYNFYLDNPPIGFNQTFIADSVCYNVSQMAKQVEANAIIVFTHSGHTAIKVASHRPKASIYVFTPTEELVSKLSLVWGIRAFYYPEKHQFIEQAINATVDFLKEKKHLEDGNIVVHVGDLRMREKGRANMLKVSYV